MRHITQGSVSMAPESGGIFYVFTGNAGIAGATITPDDASIDPQTANDDGDYFFTVEAGKTVIFTPTLEGYTFSPETITVTSIAANTTGQDFVAVTVYDSYNYLTDEFTGTDGDSLYSHTPTTNIEGATWGKFGGDNLVISGNTVTSSSSDAKENFSGFMSGIDTNFYIEATGKSTLGPWGICIRANATSGIGITLNPGNNLFSIYKVTYPSTYEIYESSNPGLTIANNNKIGILCIGNYIYVFFNDVFYKVVEITYNTGITGMGVVANRDEASVDSFTFSDNVYIIDENTISESISGTSAFSSFARMPFATDATAAIISATVTVYSDYAGWAITGLREDGVYKSQLAYTANGNNAIVSTLSSGNKTVDIVSSPIQASHGAYPTAVWFNGGAKASSYSPALTIYGDSILSGYAADPVTQKAWGILVRDAVGSLVMDGNGARKLYDDAPDAAGRTALAARLTTGSPSEIWLAIGTNDYGSSPWSASDFGVAYADLLDKIHAALADTIIYCQTPIHRTIETANLHGDTLGDYRTQIETEASIRAWCTSVDGTAEAFPQTGDLSDGVHPTTAGHLMYANAVKAILGI